MVCLHFIISSPIDKDLFDTNLFGQDERRRIQNEREDSHPRILHQRLYEREDVAQFLARNQGLSWVAVDGSAIVGAALCGNDGRRGHIYHLAVDPAYQRCGLGKRLLDACLNGLRKAGIKRVIIMVADDNQRGTRFWERVGWEKIPGAVPMGIDL